MLEATEVQEKLIHQGKCPFCKAAEHLLGGPRGGLAQNIYCKNCGGGFNVVPQPFDCDIIKGPGPLPYFMGGPDTILSAAEIAALPEPSAPITVPRVPSMAVFWGSALLVGIAIGILLLVALR